MHTSFGEWMQLAHKLHHFAWQIIITQMIYYVMLLYTNNTLYLMCYLSLENTYYVCILQKTTEVSWSLNVELCATIQMFSGNLIG